MNKPKLAAFGMTILVPASMLFLPPISLAIAAERTPLCTTATCSKQRAILRQLERMRPTRKLTRTQIFNRIKSACNTMRRLDCPGIREYKPNICFTDF